MSQFLIAVLAVIFVLGVAINIHEFGHFIVAKMLGMRVDAYSFFGLGPRLFGFKIGNTDYRISAIPLGAYVQLHGDNATAPLEGGQDEEKRVPLSEHYELRPRWQKFLVLIGGPFMNIVLALGIPFAAAMMYGVPSMPAPIVGTIKAGGAAEKAGIKVGDRIVKFETNENPTWQRIQNDSLLIPEKATPIVVERDGQKLDLTITPTKFERDGNALGSLDFEPDFGEEPVVIGSLEADFPAVQSGLQTGDRILSVNNTTVRNRDNLMTLIKDNKDATLNLVIDRNGARQEIATKTKIDAEGKPRIGIGFTNTPTTREPATFASASGFAWNTNIEILRLTGRAFGQIGTGERSARQTVSGPIGIVAIIAKVATESGWAGLFGILGLISLNLGIFNLLPIPLLDGGQIVVLGIEGALSLVGMKLSMLVKERIQLAGLGIILLLMVFVIFNDVSKLFGV
ncbi:MAG: RIP metalloprotease RseP [Pyrinomonadaceae bacterium]|nr:RIP metalloprotease RseP [Pyrinomonadaceae bacterium]